MPVTGNSLQPRELAGLCHDAGWRDADLIMAVSVCLSESGGYPHAWHDNKKAIIECQKGQIVANVETYEHFTVIDPAAGKIKHEDGTVESYPLTVDVITSRDVGLFQINIPADGIGTEQEDALYDPEANVQTAFRYWQGRKWQPWYGYTNGYATATEWWHWSPIRQEWVAPGRYLHRAVRGVANYHAKEFGLSPTPFTDYYSIPKKPTAPPP